MVSLFKLPPGLYEPVRLDANHLANGKEIRLVSLEETQQGGQQFGFGRTSFQLVCPDSGQIEKTLRPPGAPERCCERCKGKSDWVIVDRA